MTSRPNILLVMTDQHRGDCLGVDSHPDLLTPNLDALAGSGTRFSRAYSTCPSCIPARRALLTGTKHPSGLDGRSLVPFLRGARPSWRKFLHGEHSACYSKDQAHHFLVDATTKYIWRPEDGSEQLVDLLADPQELQNLADQPKHQERLILWRKRLIETLIGRPENFMENKRLIAGQPYPET